MADSKLVDLTASASPASGDIVYVVVDPGAAPLDRKMTIDDLMKTVNVLPENTAPLSTDVLLLMDDPGGTLAAEKVTVGDVLDLVVVPVISAQVFLSAGAAVPKTTAGCAAAAQVEMATNKQNLKTLDFDTTTEEHADFTFALPSDYDGGTMTAKFVWMHPATTDDFGVTWGIAGRCYADGDALDAAPGTEVMVDDTGGTTSDVYISPATAAITWAGTPAAGQLINLTVARKPGEAGDTMAVDAKLIGVQLTYTRA